MGMCKVGSVLRWQVICLTAYLNDCRHGSLGIGGGSSRTIFSLNERSINLDEQTFYS